MQRVVASVKMSFGEVRHSTAAGLPGFGSCALLLTRSCMISAIRAKAGELLIPEIIPAADGPHALLPCVQHCSTIAEDQGVNDEST